ncbi:hypothetical protein R3W88_031700 [Solanum pinnatisectum]|uniref:NB-ARC domain-containing protein n=1 Tax=Solanum pinnatisectum TaxID=50273 RepID=A0AAV9LMQ8_9SOLN|nr:hypothetical protein R3W88_031700 [Solanum pinnatisectum]
MAKRYLIVLDDMWDCMAWDDLRLSFPDVGNRSRIVYHTDPYSLPFIPLDESCKLLRKKVFQKEDCPPELQDVSQAVAEKCKGLPLVIVLVAGIIKKKRKMEDSWWNEVKNSLLSYLGESEEYSLSTMQLSYDNLPDCLKPCLLYLGMFSKDEIILVSKLTSLWIAEDFVQNIESGRLIEEAAEGYLMDLISSNLVMVSERKYNGKVKYCQVHDVVLHFCLEKSREEKFMLAVKGHYSQLQPFQRKESRVSFNFSKELSEFASLGSKIQKPLHQHSRSLIMTNRAESYGWNPIRQVSEVRLLKVLDLSSCGVRVLSSVTFKPLIHLKYLTVSTKEFDFHPEPHLPNLETLIVEGLSKLIVLPAIFWKMEKLRHVETGEAELYLKWESNKKGMFEESSKLENLSILSVIPFIAGLPNLEYLQLSMTVQCQRQFGLGDITFHKLKFLKLVFLDISRWDASDESFPLLETLVISWCDNLEEIPLSFADIPTLKQIKLIWCDNKSLEASAVRIKEEVKDIEGCDRIDLIIKASINKLLCVVFECLCGI